MLSIVPSIAGGIEWKPRMPNQVSGSRTKCCAIAAPDHPEIGMKGAAAKAAGSSRGSGGPVPAWPTLQPRGWGRSHCGFRCRELTNLNGRFSADQRYRNEHV
jgi:hypothetical protein